MLMSFDEASMAGTGAAGAGAGGTGAIDAGGVAIVVGGFTAEAVMGVGMRGAGTGVVDFKGGVDRAATAAAEAADFLVKTGDVAVTDGDDDEDDSEMALLAPPAVTPGAGVGVGGCDAEAFPTAGDPAADLTRTGDGTLVAAGEAVDLDAAGDDTRMAAGDTVRFLAGALLAIAAAAAVAALAGEAPAALPGVDPGLPDHCGGRTRVSFLTTGDLLVSACGVGTVDLFEPCACIDTAPNVTGDAVAKGESRSILGKGAMAAVAGVLLLALDTSEAGSVLTLTAANFGSSRSMSMAAAGAW
jgi:hypothetical protein